MSLEQCQDSFEKLEKQHSALQAANKKLVEEKRELERQNKLPETAAYFAEMIISEHSESNYGQMREWISKFEQLELDWPIKDAGALQDGKRLDWLEKNWCDKVKNKFKEDILVVGGVEARGTDLRQVIDKAMAKERGGDGQD